MDEITRHLETARERYDRVDFNSDALFNNPAPEPIVAFIIGGVLSVLGVFMWLRRVHLLKKKMAARDPPMKLVGGTLLRAYISCAIDSDSPFYTIVSFGAVSFLFLGGIQLHYKWTLLAMIVTYTFSSMGETIRILIAFSNANSLADVVLTSKYLASQLRGVSTELQPSNVYEDIGRGQTIVSMVFITQVVLIAFVCVDVFDNGTNPCRDGSAECPIAGTLGSWCFYVLGVFMACVFQLGPKTRFGESEQNPAYWLQLLLATKQSGAKCTWYDPVMDKTKERALSPHDLRTWLRFFMSFLINGVGYHILVHALPIQVAAQSSLTGVVFRAVGMMYLVDLDDTTGYNMTVVQQEEAKPEEKKGEIPAIPDAPTSSNVSEEVATDGVNNMPPSQLSEEAQRIIEEARQKLDALARGEVPMGGKRFRNQDLLVGVLLDEEGTEPAAESRAIANGTPERQKDVAEEGDDVEEA